MSLCSGVRPAPLHRLQPDAVRGAARPGHGRRHPRPLLPPPDPQEAPQCGRQQPEVRREIVHHSFFKNIFGYPCQIFYNYAILLAAVKGSLPKKKV